MAELNHLVLFPGLNRWLMDIQDKITELLWME